MFLLLFSSHNHNAHSSLLLQLGRLLPLRIHKLLHLHIIPRQLLHELGLCAANRLYLEQPIHAIKRHALRLRDQEPHENHGKGAHRAEEEVHPAPVLAHARDHVGRDARDDERPQPIRHGRADLPHVAGGLVEHLCVDDPGGSVPGGDVDAGPEVDHEDGGDALAGEAGALGRGGLGHD